MLQFGFRKKSFPHVEEELRFRPAVGRRVQHSLGNGPPELLGPPHSSATFGRQKLVDAVDSGQTLSQRALECLGNDERWEECCAVEERPFCVGKPGLGTGFPTQNGLLAIFGQLNFPDRWCIRKD